MRDWEDELDLLIIWACPECGYTYESEPYVNEALACPYCLVETEQVGESYNGESKY